MGTVVQLTAVRQTRQDSSALARGQHPVALVLRPRLRGQAEGRRTCGVRKGGLRQGRRPARGATAAAVTAARHAGRHPAGAAAAPAGRGCGACFCPKGAGMAACWRQSSRQWVVPGGLLCLPPGSAMSRARAYSIRCCSCCRTHTGVWATRIIIHIWGTEHRNGLGQAAPMLVRRRGCCSSRQVQVRHLTGGGARPAASTAAGPAVARPLVGCGVGRRAGPRGLLPLMQAGAAAALPVPHLVLHCRRLPLVALRPQCGCSTAAAPAEAADETGDLGAPLLLCR